MGKPKTPAEAEDASLPPPADAGALREAWKTAAAGGSPKAALARADKAVALMAVDEAAIRDHPQRKEILSALTYNALLPAHERMGWREVSIRLKHDHGIDLSPDKVRLFTVKHIVPALFITPEFVKEGLWKAGHDLNTAKEKLDTYTKLKKRYDELIAKTGDEEEDPNTLAHMARSLVKMQKEIEDSLERYNVVPGRRLEVETTSLHVTADLDRILDRMEKSSRAGPTIDVTPRPPTAPSTPSTSSDKVDEPAASSGGA